MLFCAGITMLTSVMAYLLPAWPALRNLVAAAREGSHGSTASGGQIRARGLLVSVQVGLSFLLLAGAGLLLRSFYELVNTDSGVQMERVLSMRVNPNWTKINTPQKYIELFQSLLDRIRATPGVMAAGIGNKVPLNQRLPVTRNFLIEGQAPPDGAPKPVLDLAAVSVGYFETLRVPVMRGRLFAESDGPDSPRVALVNDIMAKHYWPQQDPIGRRVSLDNGQQWTTIVGVIPNIKQYSLDTEVGDELYLPFLQNSSGTNVVVRSALDPGALAGHLRQAVHGIDPDHAVSAIQTLEEIRQESVAPQRLLTLLLTLSSALTLAITIAGIGGVAALSVEQRRSEIGIRVACGARPGEIVGLVLRQHLSLVVAGMVAGVAASLALGRVMSTFLYRTQPTDAVTFASVCLLVMAVGAIDCWVPARRASVMDPMKSLRAE